MVAKCFVKTQSLSSEEGAGNAIICVVIKGCDPMRLSLSAFDCSRSEQYIGKMDGKATSCKQLFWLKLIVDFSPNSKLLLSSPSVFNYTIINPCMADFSLLDGSSAHSSHCDFWCGELFFF